MLPGLPVGGDAGAMGRAAPRRVPVTTLQDLGRALVRTRCTCGRLDESLVINRRVNDLDKMRAVEVVDETEAHEGRRFQSASCQYTSVVNSLGSSW